MRKVVFVYNGERISYEKLMCLVHETNTLRKVTATNDYMNLPLDVIDEIVKHIKCGKTYKSILQSCSYLYKTYVHLTDKYCNHLWTLINANKIPGKKLNWQEITRNPNTPISMFTRYPQKPWALTGILANPNITPEFVENCMQGKVVFIKNRRKQRVKVTNNSFSQLSRRMPMQYIEEHMEYPWDWRDVSENPNLTMEFVLKYIDKPWIWQQICRNPGITMEDIESTIGIEGVHWNSFDIRHNPNVTSDFIERLFNSCAEHIRSSNYDQKLYNAPKEYIRDVLQDMKPDNVSTGYFIYIISQNIHIDINIVKEFISLNWRWCELSKNPAITMRDIENNMDLPWEYNHVSSNPNLTAKFVIKYAHLKWNWYTICSNGFGMKNY